MLAPDLSYRFLYPKDIAGPTFELCARSANDSATNATVTSNYTFLPKDKMLCVSSMSLQADPGATQAVTDIRISFFTATGFEFNVVRRITPGTADLIEAFHWEGQVYILGRSPAAVNVRVQVIFDAGVNSNNVTSSVFGIVVPRGNVALF